VCVGLQVLYNTMLPSVPSLVPGLVALFTLSAYFAVKVSVGQTKEGGALIVMAYT